MSLQNRVDPWGAIHAVPERGTMMGNRGGRFHRGDQTLGKRRWASHHWICCELHWNNAHHEPMGRGYTSVFFLDEVTALAAGHRPCFFCRRTEAREFIALSGLTTDAFDRQLHQERIPLREAGRVAAQQPGGASDAALAPPASHALGTLPTLRAERDIPDGAMIEIDDAAFAVRGAHLLRWSFAGYTERLLRKPSLHGRLLTCPSIAAILARGYKPRWHESANQWGIE